MLSDSLYNRDSRHRDCAIENELLIMLFTCQLPRSLKYIRVKHSKGRDDKKQITVEEQRLRQLVFKMRKYNLLPPLNNSNGGSNLGLPSISYSHCSQLCLLDSSQLFDCFVLFTAKFLLTPAPKENSKASLLFCMIMTVEEAGYLLQSLF